MNTTTLCYDGKRLDQRRQKQPWHIRGDSMTLASGMILAITMLTLIQPNAAMAACPGCGVSTGNSPCYYDGQTYYDWTGEYYGTPNGIYRDICVYYSRCIIHQTVTYISGGGYGQAGNHDTWADGGCYCDELPAQYDEIEYPFFQFDLVANMPYEYGFVTPEPLSRFAIHDVINDFDIYSREYIAAGDTVYVSRDIVQNSVFSVQGYVPSGRLDGSLVVSELDGTISIGKHLLFWNEEGAITVRDLAVYIGDGTVKIFRQFDDNSIELVSGVTSYGDLLSPMILNVDCSSPGGSLIPEHHWAPMESDVVTITADITDDQSLSSAVLYYRDSDGVTPGAWYSASGLNLGGDRWGFTVPGPHTQSQVDFYIQAVDNEARATTYPGGAPVMYQSVAIGVTSIYEMQYADLDAPEGPSAYEEKYLNIEGIVTAVPGGTGSEGKLVIQEADVDPETGNYAFGAVLVYEGGSNFMDYFYRGDRVRIGGYGYEHDGMTELRPRNFSAVNLISFDGDLPPSTLVRTGVLADDSLAEVDGTGRLGEAWECVWVRTPPSSVMGLTSFGGWLLSDTATVPDTVVVHPYVELIYEPIIGRTITVEGFMNYNLGAFEIVPISDEFINDLGIVGIEDQLPSVLPAGGFTNITPNPFNPIVEICFKLNRDNLVQLSVYDLRGHKVRTLVQGSIPADKYTFTWDGTDDDGHGLSSGTYFARLRIGSDVTQVRKISMVK